MATPIAKYAIYEKRGEITLLLADGTERSKDFPIKEEGKPITEVFAGARVLKPDKKNAIEDARVPLCLVDGRYLEVANVSYLLQSDQESVSGFRRGGSAEQFFSVVKEKLKPPPLAISDSWTEMMFKDFEPEKNDLGRLFPFLGRDKQIALLGRLITDLMSWWEAVRPKIEAGVSQSELHKSTVVAGFAFFVIGAASGIGKSTFARRAFPVLYEWFSKSNNAVEKKLAAYLYPCILSKTLFRITYVTGIEDFERHEPKLSIALRVLFEYCKWRLLVPCEFASFCSSFTQFPAALNLNDVLKWIRARTQSDMFVIHVDETNHLAAKDTEYVVDIMHSMYSAMLERHFFLTCLFSGTNAEFLMSLKRTSNFNVIPIHLPPLKTGELCEILQEVTTKISGENERQLRPQIEWLLDEDGGNPQILKSQIFLMGQLGGDYTVSTTSQAEPVPSPSIILMAADRPTELPSRELTGWNSQKFLEFMRSQSVQLVSSLRDNTIQQLVSSHILSSIEKLRENKPLQRILLGYAISGDLVRRQTKLLGEWTVGLAESAGFIYMSAAVVVGQTDLCFRVILPRIFMGYFAANATPDDLFNLEILKTGWAPLSFRNIEFLDVTALAFFFEWHFEKHPEADTCQLRDVFPKLGLPAVVLKKPPNFRHESIRFSAAKGEDFTVKASNFAQVAVFTLGCGNDSFPDAWGHYKDTSDEPFTIFIQSRKTITNKAFTTDDLEVQLKYLEGIKSHWLLLVVTDGPTSAIIPADFEEKVCIAEGAQQEFFYGHMLATMRRTALSVERIRITTGRNHTHTK